MDNDETKDDTKVTEVTKEPLDKTQGKPEETEKIPKNSEDSEKSEESDNSDKPENSEGPENPDKTENTDGSEIAEEPDKPEISDKPDTSEPSDADDSMEPTKVTGRIVLSDKTDVKGAHWYVVHTYSGHEAKVAATLKQRVESQKLSDKVLEILVPTQEKIEIKEGKKSKVREKIFPGYILIKMVLDDQSWLAVRTTPGITSFVGNLNKPTPLPESEVASIQRFIQMEAPKFKTTFSVGEAVKIVDGPFSEFLGSVQEMDEEKGKVKVLVSIFGRETPVELDFLQIAKL